jgi:hypothetical protein
MAANSAPTNPDTLTYHHGKVRENAVEEIETTILNNYIKFI